MSESSSTLTSQRGLRGLVQNGHGEMTGLSCGHGVQLYRTSRLGGLEIPSRCIPKYPGEE
jgi:hypothetical protein